MKKILAGVVIASLAIGGALLAQDKDDSTVTEGVVNSMTAAQLNGPPKPNPVNGPKEMTAQVVASILEELQDPAANGGIVAIAHRHKCSSAQVRLVAKKKAERLQELAPSPVDLNP